MSTPPLGRALALVAVTAASLAACTVETAALPVEKNGESASAFSVGGCNCPQSGSCDQLSYTDIPGDNMYYVTTFGGGADTGPMACGGTADATWAYVADSARFGCGAKVLIEANGKSCVGQVADCGPNQCVEEAAAYSGCTTHHPIVDVSPFITEYIFGISGSGWSDQRSVKVTEVPSSTAIGCPGGPPPPPPPPELDAKFVGQGSDAPADPTKKAYYQVCAGQSFHFWFELENTGAAAWVDANDTTAGHWGRAVRLGVPGDKPDLFAATARISITGNANDDVHGTLGSPKGGDCNDKPGCARTVFSKNGGIAAKAPDKAGIYKTTWKLVDEKRAWFGPEMWLTFNVMECPSPPGSDGGPPVVFDGGPGGGGDSGGGGGTNGSGDGGVGTSAGCSVAASVGTRNSAPWALAVVLLSAAAARRRKRPLEAPALS